jgi:hypothetical protein
MESCGSSVIAVNIPTSLLSFSTMPAREGEHFDAQILWVSGALNTAGSKSCCRRGEVRRGAHVVIYMYSLVLDCNVLQSGRAASLSTWVKHRKVINTGHSCVGHTCNIMAQTCNRVGTNTAHRLSACDPRLCENTVPHGWCSATLELLRG